MCQCSMSFYHGHYWHLWPELQLDGFLYYLIFPWRSKSIQYSILSSILPRYVKRIKPFFKKKFAWNRDGITLASKNVETVPNISTNGSWDVSTGFNVQEAQKFRCAGQRKTIRQSQDKCSDKIKKDLRKVRGWKWLKIARPSWILC